MKPSLKAEAIAKALTDAKKDAEGLKANGHGNPELERFLYSLAMARGDLAHYIAELCKEGK